ncbi:hypothetical protein E2C01_083719 [Portunus trituberculatus]|uniref:Uncharacterized protein n=1 Tax=Portunus trituberculatus TaxID=210409 RepID=A0A5B7J7A9_PORTR|nr:hypothetical protein [Portunus trituberculatus]
MCPSTEGVNHMQTSLSLPPIQAPMTHFFLELREVVAASQDGCISSVDVSAFFLWANPRRQKREMATLTRDRSISSILASWWRKMEKGGREET